MSFNIALLIILIALIVAISFINPNFIQFNYVMSVVIKNIIEIGLMALPDADHHYGGITFRVGSIMIVSAISGGMAAAVYGNGVGVIIGLLVVSPADS